MARSLFRSEAIDHNRARIWGEMTLPVPVPITVTTAFLGLCILAIAVFLAEGTYTRKEHVPGFLIPHLGVARIMPPRSGTIVAVHVLDGGLVQRGDPLLTVSVEQATGHGQDVDSAMLDSLKQQADRLQDQMALEQRKADADRAAIGTAIAGLSQMLAALDTEHRIQVERTEVARREMTAITGLVQHGDMSLLEQRRRQDAYLSQQQAESGTARAILDKQSALDQRRNELAELPIATAARIAQLQAAIADITTRIVQTEGQRSYLLRAPMAGRVSALQAWVGKTADPGIPQMSIVPEGDALQAELLVPARAIGFVAPGQRVRLSYDTFPYQQFGFAEGRVETISRTLLKPGEMIGPILFDAPSYRVSVALARQTISAYGTDLPLQTDTQLQADILLDSRSLLAWLLDPLGKIWGRS
jgi:membrane fusion protein